MAMFGRLLASDLEVDSLEYTDTSAGFMPLLRLPQDLWRKLLEQHRCSERKLQGDCRHTKGD